MNPSSLSGAMAAAASVRPSLFPLPGAVPTAMADPADALRILSSVSAPSAARPALRWGWIAAGSVAALGLLAALAGVMPSARQEAQQEARQEVHQEVRQEVRQAAPEASQAVAAAARIETAPEDAARRDPFSALDSALGAAADAAPSAAASGAVAGGSSRTGAPEGSRERVGVGANASTASRSSAWASAHATRATSAHEGGKDAAARPDDSDVDLLEAVVARVAGKPVTPASSRSAGAPPAASPKKAADKKASKPGDKSGDKSADKAGAAAQRSSTLADQVQHCREVGGLEGWLCRNRVCDGHWGVDAACPLSAPTKPPEP